MFQFPKEDKTNFLLQFVDQQKVQVNGKQNIKYPMYYKKLITYSEYSSIFLDELTIFNNLILQCQLPLQFMIQQHKDYFHRYQLSRLLLFKNAIYQGGYSSAQKAVNGNGFVYFPKQNRVIICNNFKQGQIHNHALVYHNAQKYLYGSWRNNKLQGLVLIRIADTVLIANFLSGKINKENKAVLLLHQYHLALLLRFQNGEWEAVQRVEIYCKQHILQFFKKSGLGDHTIHLSLISFLNQQIAESENQFARLRFINNNYQYAFDGGLHLIFSRNQQFSGLKFTGQNIFSFSDTRSKNQQQKLISIIRKNIQRQRSVQAGMIYKQKQLNHQYILPNQFQDPSSEYFSFLENTFNKTLLKKLRAGLFRSSKNKNSEFNFSQFHLQIHPVHKEIFPGCEAIQNQLKESIIQKTDQQEFVEYSWQKSITQKDQVIQTTSFQMLPQESRLNIIKKEQRQILNWKYLRQKHNLSQSQKSPAQDNQSFGLNEESHQNRKRFQDKYSQTEVVLLTSPLTVKHQSASPPSQKRKRVKIFNTQSLSIQPSTQKTIGQKYIQVQTVKRSNNKLQIENVVSEVHLSKHQKKQASLSRQMESRIAKEIQNDRIDTILVKKINCSPIKKSKQFSLDNTQILTTPIRDKQQNKTTEIKRNTNNQQIKQEHQAQPHFIAIRNHKSKNSKSSKKYDIQGLFDKKLLFDYKLI